MKNYAGSGRKPPVLRHCCVNITRQSLLKGVILCLLGTLVGIGFLDISIKDALEFLVLALVFAMVFPETTVDIEAYVANRLGEPADRRRNDQPPAHHLLDRRDPHGPFPGGGDDDNVNASSVLQEADVPKWKAWLHLRR